MTITKGYFETKHQKVNLLNFNAKMFNICGIIPNENINASLWKFIPFRMFQILSFLVYICFVTLQLFGLYYYWGNIGLLTDCIGFTAACSFAYISAAYFIFYWKEVSKLIEAFETNSIYSIEFVRLNQRHMKIVTDTRNFILLLSKLSSLFTLLAGIVYISPTIIQQLSTSDKQILEEIETTEGFTKYFVFVMWIPPILKQPHVIRITYVLQVTCTSVGFLFAAAIAPLEYVLIIYTGTQFKIVSSVLQEMDVLISRLQNPDKIVDNAPEQMDNPDDTRRFLPEYSRVTKCELGTEEGKTPATGQWNKQLNSKALDNLLQAHDVNRSSVKSNDLSSAELTPWEENDVASSYLLQCIKLHQACIQ
jgi:hypothetical protein